MAYEDEVRRVADHLAHLITAPGPTVPDELPLIDSGRRAVRGLCEQILGDLRPDNPHRGSPLVRLTEPAIHTLRRLLRSSPTALAHVATGSHGWAQEPQTETGRRWRELRRSAILASHEWSLIYPQVHPSGRDAWPIVTDVAAIAEALALAELDLEGGGATAPGRARREDSWRLAFVAEHVRRLSPRDLPGPNAPLPSRRQHVLLRVPSIGDAPAAAGRVATLLHTGRRLRPESVRAIARSHAEILLRVAKVLDQDRRPDRRDPGLIDGLRTMAAKLEDLAGEARSYRALEPDAPGAVQQLELIRDRWRKPIQIDETTRTAALKFIPPALTVVTALGDAIEQQVDNGNWYIHVKHGRYRWQRTNASTRPPIFAVAQRSVAHADELRNQLPRPSSPTGPGSPRDILADHIRARAVSAEAPWL
jgi:hypothetical protein